MTRDIKPRGKCPKCDLYWERHSEEEEEPFPQELPTKDELWEMMPFIRFEDESWYTATAWELRKQYGLS